MWKNVHPVHSTGIQTHDLRNMTSHFHQTSCKYYKVSMLEYYDSRVVFYERKMFGLRALALIVLFA